MLNYGNPGQRHTYTNVSGTFAVPRSDGSPKVVRLHAPCGMREVSWEYSRQDRPPEVPAQGDLDNDTFLSGVVSLPTPIPNSTGDGFSWMVSGTYVYLQNDVRVLDGTTSLPTGTYPFPLEGQEALADALTPGGLDATLVSGTGLGESVGVGLGNNTFPWPFTTYPASLVNDALLES